MPIIDKRVKPLAEITDGKLLTIAEIEGGMPSYDIPQTSYTLDVPGNLFIRDNTFEPAHQVEVTTPEVFGIFLPIIKGYFPEEMITKWALPEVYTTVAKQRDYPHQYICCPYIYGYQQRIKMYATALDLYKELINDFLQLTVVKDREIVKSRILSDILYTFVLDISHKLDKNLESDIKDSIKKYGLTNIPQRIIDMWTEITSTQVAMCAEGNNNIRTYNSIVRKLNKTSNSKTKHLETYSDHEHLMLVNHSYLVKDLLKQRQLALNSPVEIGEQVEVKIHPLIVTFSKQFQKATDLIVNSYSNEESLLLDTLEGYDAEYIAPSAIKSSPLDYELKLIEKTLIQQTKNFDKGTSVELLEIVASGLKLLSLVHMRYRISLNDKNDYTYFGLSKTNAAIDKDNYYRIFAFYMEHIFNKSLASLTTMAHDGRIICSNVATQVVATVHELGNYLQDIKNQDDTNVRRSAKILHELQAKIGIDETIQRHNMLENDLGLRHRAGRKVSTNTL